LGEVHGEYGIVTSADAFAESAPESGVLRQSMKNARRTTRVELTSGRRAQNWAPWPASIRHGRLLFGCGRRLPAGRGGWRHAATVVGLDGPMNISIIA
jgi:hypothetical protein